MDEKKQPFLKSRKDEIIAALLSALIVLGLLLLAYYSKILTISEDLDEIEKNKANTNTVYLTSKDVSNLVSKYLNIFGDKSNGWYTYLFKEGLTEETKAIITLSNIDYNKEEKEINSFDFTTAMADLKSIEKIYVRGVLTEEYYKSHLVNPKGISLEKLNSKHKQLFGDSDSIYTGIITFANNCFSYFKTYDMYVKTLDISNNYEYQNELYKIKKYEEKKDILEVNIELLTVKYTFDDSNKGVAITPSNNTYTFDANETENMNKFLEFIYRNEKGNLTTKKLTFKKNSNHKYYLDSIN